MAFYLITLFGRRAFDMVGGVISRELLRPIFANAMNIFPGGAKKMGSPSVKEEAMVWQSSSPTGSCK